MDHVRLVTATIQCRNQNRNISHTKINYLENIYGVVPDMRLNVGEYLGHNRAFSGSLNLPLKVTKLY